MADRMRKWPRPADPGAGGAKDGSRGGDSADPRNQAGRGRRNRQAERDFLRRPAARGAPDFTHRYASDGQVRDTVIFYYEEDARAAGAKPGSALRREAVYAGPADPYRLHAARKLSDTFLVGPAGQELRDRRVDYHADGQAASTTIFYYEGDRRAKDASIGDPLRRQVVTEGT